MPMYLSIPFIKSNSFFSIYPVFWRFWRNKANTLVKKGKTTYCRGLIEANMKDSKMLWNIVRDLAPNTKSALPVSL